jgi:hypothetical protein
MARETGEAAGTELDRWTQVIPLFADRIVEVLRALFALRGAIDAVENTFFAGHPVLFRLGQENLDRIIVEMEGLVHSCNARNAVFSNLAPQLSSASKGWRLHHIDLEEIRRAGTAESANVEHELCQRAQLKTYESLGEAAAAEDLLCSIQQQEATRHGEHRKPHAESPRGPAVRA